MLRFEQRDTLAELLIDTKRNIRDEFCDYASQSHSGFKNRRVIVIDNDGGYTTDWLAVNPGGEVDFSLARSVPIGIQSVITNFEDSFRANNLEAVKDTPPSATP